MKIVTSIFLLASWMLVGIAGAEPVLDNKPQDQESTSEMEKYRDISSLSGDQKEHDTIALPSGLRYQVLRAGLGDSPQSSDIVTVHHRGRTLSGKIIGDTYQKGVPQTFPVDHVIPAWTEALQLMKTGARWRLFVPPELAYGEKGWGDKVGPNESLVYEIELVDIPVTDTDTDK